MRPIWRVTYRKKPRRQGADPSIHELLVRQDLYTEAEARSLPRSVWAEEFQEIISVEKDVAR